MIWFFWGQAGPDSHPESPKRRGEGASHRARRGERPPGCSGGCRCGCGPRLGGRRTRRGTDHHVGARARRRGRGRVCARPCGRRYRRRARPSRGAGRERRLDRHAVSGQPRGLHPRYRELILGQGLRHGAWHPVRRGLAGCAASHLRNATIEAGEGAGRPPSGQRPGEGDVLGQDHGNDVARDQSLTAQATFEGDVDAPSLWSGQGVGLVHGAQPAAEIVREIADQARAVIARLGTDRAS